MKRIKITVAAVLMFLGLPSFSSLAQQPGGNQPYYMGVGPVERASVDVAALNKHAKKFIEKYFPGVAVTKCYKEFPSQTVEVELANGVEMEFSKNGKILEIDAPDNASLPVDVVRHIVPRETFRKLHAEGFDTEVESITHDSYGYKVELNDDVYDEIRFDKDGLFVAIYTED